MLRSFQIFSKIREYIRKSRCTTGGNLATGVNDTGGKIAAGINDTGGKFATGINDIGGKFCHQFGLCCWHRWQICHQCQRYRRQICRRCQRCRWPASCHRYQRHRQQIFQQCRWHRWQIMGTISGCRHLRVNLKAKIYIYVNSTSQRCPNKIIKIFLIEDFFHLPPVSKTPVVHLEPWISPRIFEKVRNGRNGILRCLGETDSWKKPEVENLVTLSLSILKRIHIKTEFEFLHCKPSIKRKTNIIQNMTKNIPFLLLSSFNLTQPLWNKIIIWHICWSKQIQELPLHSSTLLSYYVVKTIVFFFTRNCRVNKNKITPPISYLIASEFQAL